MGSDNHETAAAADEGPTVKAVVDHITDNWTSSGVYARGSGDEFLQVVLPNRMVCFPSFLAEVEQCAGTGSRVVYVATNEETRLDVYLGSRYDDGRNPLATRSGPSTIKILVIGMFAGIVSAFAVLFFAAKLTAAK